MSARTGRQQPVRRRNHNGIRQILPDPARLAQHGVCAVVIAHSTNGISLGTTCATAAVMSGTRSLYTASDHLLRTNWPSNMLATRRIDKTHFGPVKIGSLGLVFRFTACTGLKPSPSSHRKPTWQECTTMPPRKNIMTISDPGGNGRELLGLGIRLDGSDRFMVVERIDANDIATQDHHKITGVSIRHHELTGLLDSGASVTGRAWKGTKLYARVRCLHDDSQYFRLPLYITEVEPRDVGIDILGNGPPPEMQFSLTISRPDWQMTEDDAHIDRKQINACAEPEAEPRNYNNVAFPVSSYWDLYGARKEGTQQGAFNFACLDHGVVKCLRKRYPMHDANESMTSLFDACTRAMRADYCANGNSFTKDGTPVTVRDSTIFPQQPKEGQELEAAWTAKEAVCINHVRMTIPPIKRAAAKCLKDLPKCGNEQSEMQRAGKGAPSLIFSYSKPINNRIRAE
jgi:hypothetical protein